MAVELNAKAFGSTAFFFLDNVYKLYYIYLCNFNKPKCLKTKGEKQMDAGGSCSHARNKIRYFGGLKTKPQVASVFVIV